MRGGKTKLGWEEEAKGERKIVASKGKRGESENVYS